MAVDNKAKRASIIGYGSPFSNVFPAPDGAVDTEQDRKNLAGVYVGSLSGTTEVDNKFNTFEPPKAPSQPLDDEPELAMSEARFGDGYEQRAPKGINWVRSIIDIQWNYCTRTQADAIIAFFENQKLRTFNYQMPQETVVRRWVVVSWRRSDRVDGYVDVRAKFRESFELG